MKKLKQYQYRGWMQAGSFLLLLIGVVVTGIVRKNIEVFIMPGLPMGFMMVMGFAQQRQLTEEEWRHEQAQDDERSRMLSGKAAYISWVVTAIAISAGILCLALLDNEIYEPCMDILFGIAMVHFLVFLIAYAVLKKKN